MAERSRWARAFCGALFCILPAAAAADGCAAVQMSTEEYRQAAQLAGRVLLYLQQSGADVVLLGRVGSDAPQKRFVKKISFWNYTHAGLAYRSHPAGAWTVVHLLNICGEQSGVFEESLLKFFLDKPFEYRAVVAVPSPPLQRALEELIVGRNAAAAYRDNSVYSSISYPFSLARQNSNEYILDTMAAALALQEGRAAPDRSAAKEYFLTSPYRDNFSPEILQAGFWESLAASLGLGPANATLDDHTASERAGGKFEFVAVGSLIQFMDDMSMLQTAAEFSLAAATADN